ncbi:NTF2 fold immunity protein [Ralstonia solanacearum]|uniref:NTF2 fold immunity protein n=1 Tax=Ralstonia solanacearum TaxID=305 RepID=UPI0018D0FEFC
MLEKWAFPDKTNQGRLVGLGCSEPPTYDPERDVEDGVEMHDGDAVFTIRQTVGLQTIFRFTLDFKYSAWKIKKMEFLNFKDKWQRSII